MRKIPHSLNTLYKKMVQSIAFIPSIMILGSFLLGVIVFYFEDYEYSLWLKNKNLEFILISGADNARMVLGTIIGGIISLTVFSFSMVMVVLNRASTSLTPRLLPQLIAQKSHQVVLGFNMGTIVYSLILIISIQPDKSLPALGILFSMMMAISSLGLFVYFIHSISNSIQVDNIMRSILRATERQLNAIHEMHDEYKSLHILPETKNWSYTNQITAPKTAYYFFNPTEAFIKRLQKINSTMVVRSKQGGFLKQGDLLAECDQEVDKELKTDILNYFYAGDDLSEGQDYHENLRKISEVAVKALSPGINDPGTALIAIRLLTILFEKIVRLPGFLVYPDKEGTVRVYQLLPSLDELLASNITPIRHYSGGSGEILSALFDFFEALLRKAGPDLFTVLNKHVIALVQSADATIKINIDRQSINKSIEKIRHLPYCIQEEIPFIA